MNYNAHFVQRLVSDATYKIMGAKLCAGNDTPWITFKCVFINRSTNVDVGGADGTDGAQAVEDDTYEIRQCCCIQWRRPKSEKSQTIANEMSKEQR